MNIIFKSQKTFKRGILIKISSLKMRAFYVKENQNFA